MNVWFMTFVCILCMITYIYNIYLHAYTRYMFISTYIYIYMIYIYIIYIARQGASRNTIAPLPTCRSFASWLSSSSEAPGYENPRIGRFGLTHDHLTRPQKKQQPPATKKIRKFPGLSQEMAQEIREEGSSKASKQTWGSFGWEDSSSQTTSEWSYDPNAPAIFPNAPVATAVIAIAGHGVFFRGAPQRFVATKTKIFNCWDFINLNLFC